MMNVESPRRVRCLRGLLDGCGFAPRSLTLHGSLVERSHDERIDFVLTQLRPLGVMLFTDADGVSQETSNLFHRRALFEQVNREGVPQSIAQHVACIRY